MKRHEILHTLLLQNFRTEGVGAVEPSLKAQKAWENRASYAMFHAAEAALLARYGLAFSSHGGAIGAFGKHFARTGLVSRRLHRLLIQAFDARSRADYDLAALVTPEEAHTMVTAEEFLAGVHPLIQGGAP